jgi:hypothetical protein
MTAWQDDLACALKRRNTQEHAYADLIASRSSHAPACFSAAVRSLAAAGPEDASPDRS